MKNESKLPLEEIIKHTTDILESNKMPMRAVHLWKVVRHLHSGNEFIKDVLTRKNKGENFPVELGQRLRHSTKNVATFKMSDGSRYFVFTID